MISNLKHHIKQSLDTHRIGDLLIKRGYINERQLKDALKLSQRSGKRLGKVLIHQGYISSFQLYKKLLIQWRLRIGTFGLVLIMQLMSPIVAYSDNIQTFGKNYKISYSAENIISANITEPKIFGYKEFKSNDINVFSKWTNAINRYNKQIENINMSSAKALLWNHELQKLKSKTATEQVVEINNFINAHKYIEDKDNYEKTDYWATPIEFFEQGGDCEDFAIAKYTSLKALGFNPDQMRIAIVKDTIKNIHHAILVVNVEGENFVLDNQSRNIQKVETVTRYEPIFSINSNSWWLHEA